MNFTGKKTFKGGVHPLENKHYTESCPIEAVPTPRQLVLPLVQHIGAPCKPLVQKKQAVAFGEPIGRSDAYVSAPIHSPVNGVVKDIALASHPVIGRTMAVYLEVNPEDNPPRQPQPERFGEEFDPGSFSPEQICNAIQEAGLVGMGGAGFPTRVKVEPNPAMPKHTLIINGCECEPYITCDYRIMLEWTRQILAGIRLAARAAGCQTVRIGIEDNKPEAVKAFEQVLSRCRCSEDIQIVVLKTKYPQGGERQLIRAVLDKQVPTGGIPPQIGVCVLNVATCAAIAEAVVFQKPLTHRVVTVTGRAVARPGNYYVPIGMSVQDLLAHCGGLTERAAKVVLGGPMMGFAIADMSTPLTKTCGALTVLTREDVTEAQYVRQQTACIRCGRCLMVCPEGLNPTRIAHAVKHFRMDRAEQYYLSACIECGSCSYVCPAHIELSGYIKTGKLLKAREKKRLG
ncbi:MAG: electron transport complex subunit RsxC [Anaerohalosphaeraceae bacterium]